MCELQVRPFVQSFVVQRLERSMYSSVTPVQEDNQQQGGDEFVQTVIWGQLFPFLHLGFPVCKVGMRTMLTFVLLWSFRRTNVQQKPRATIFAKFWVTPQQHLSKATGDESLLVKCWMNRENCPRGKRKSCNNAGRQAGVVKYNVGRLSPAFKGGAPNPTMSVKTRKEKRSVMGPRGLFLTHSTKETSVSLV